MMVQLQPEWGWGGWRYGEENASGKKGAKIERIKLVKSKQLDCLQMNDLRAFIHLFNKNKHT